MTSNHENDESLADKHLAYFDKTLEDLADSLNGVLTLKKMGSYEHVDRFGKPHLTRRARLIIYITRALDCLIRSMFLPSRCTQMNIFAVKSFGLGTCQRLEKTSFAACRWKVFLPVISKYFRDLGASANRLSLVKSHDHA